MDLGALDIKEVAEVQKPFYILTEDKKLDRIKDLLHSNGFNTDEYALQSYYGVTDPHRLQVIVEIIRNTQPASTVIVHRDRDFLSEPEVQTWEQAVRAMGAEPFITAMRDVEDYFLSPAYLSEKNPNFTELEAANLINQSLATLQPRLC
jgi:hypothetical protein